MKPYDPSKPLVFCHVPRTGGNALWNCCFTKWFGEKAYLYASNVDKAGPGSVIRDHWDRNFGKGVETQFPAAEQFVTFLRDPVRRVLSWYAHFRDDNTIIYTKGGPYPVCDITIEQFVDLRSGEISINMAGCLPTEAHCPIENFVFVGVQERMQKCADRMAAVLGKKPLPMKVVNKAGYDKPLAPSTEERLRSILATDYAFYERALKHWESYWESTL